MLQSLDSFCHPTTRPRGIDKNLENKQNPNKPTMFYSSRTTKTDTEECLTIFEALGPSM